jgi:hypothetical protein
MNTLLRCLMTATVLLLMAGCVSTESRISRHQAAFDAWPAEVRDKVRAGRVDVGFNQEMVQVALGDADRKSARTTAAGTEEVWAYFDHRPKFSFGLGMGVAAGSTAYGGGVVVGDSGFRDDEFLRVIFEGGRVVAIETRK